MSNIKKEILNIAKSICKESDLGISEEELSAIALYSILNKGYSNGAYEYISIHKNFFDEYYLSSRYMNNVYGFDNNQLSIKEIKFKDEENYIDLNKKYLRSVDFNYNSKLFEIIKNNIEKDSLYQMVNEINELNKKDDNNILFENFVINNSNKYNENFLISFLKVAIKRDLSEDVANSLEFKNKSYLRDEFPFIQFFDNFLDYKSRTFIISILDGLSSYEINKKLPEFINMSPDKIKYIRSNESIYNMSTIKIIDQYANMKDKEDKLEILNILYNNFNKFKIKIEEDLEILTLNLDVDVLSLYKNEINKIEEHIFKSYPDLNKDIKEVDFVINKIFLNVNSDIGVSNEGINRYNDYYVKNKSFNDIHANCNGFVYHGISTSTISGINEIGYSTNSNRKDTNLIIYESRNSLEVTSLIKVGVSGIIENPYNGELFKNIKNININDIDMLSREDLGIDVIKKSFDIIINDVIDKNIVIVNDFINSPKLSNFNKERIESLLLDIELKNKDVIFIHNHFLKNNKDEFKVINKLKLVLLKKLDEGIIDYKTAVEVNKMIKVDSIIFKEKDFIYKYSSKEQVDIEVKRLIDQVLKEKSLNINKMKV